MWGRAGLSALCSGVGRRGGEETCRVKAMGLGQGEHGEQGCEPRRERLAPRGGEEEVTLLEGPDEKGDRGLSWRRHGISRKEEVEERRKVGERAGAEGERRALGLKEEEEEEEEEEEVAASGRRCCLPECLGTERWR